jgi:hypothetical protein
LVFSSILAAAIETSLITRAFYFLVIETGLITCAVGFSIFGKDKLAIVFG